MKFIFAIHGFFLEMMARAVSTGKVAMKTNL